ncbi:MAG: zinc-binding alcohol dehydrogenase family protein [Bacteroidota bacterium]
MRAIKLVGDRDLNIELVEVEKPEIKSGQCLVKLKAASLNRRDFWITVGKYPNIKENVILGSDGSGEVVEGPDNWLGKKVIINPNIDWGDNPVAQSKEYEILGMPKDGTLAEYITVDEDRLVEKPKFLSFSQAACFPLAGLTAYRACFKKGEIQEGSKVLVTGIGGGVAQFAVSFSKAVKAEVYVTSSSDGKISDAVSLGAKGGFNYKKEDWVKTAKKEVGPFDVIIDSSGGNLVDKYLKVTKPGGKIIIYGASAGRAEGFDLPRLFWQQISIIGTSMGNDEEFSEMVEFIDINQIKPIIDKEFPMEKYRDAFRRFVDKDHYGKVVLLLS